MRLEIGRITLRVISEQTPEIRRGLWKLPRLTVPVESLMENAPQAAAFPTALPPVTLEISPQAAEIPTSRLENAGSDTATPMIHPTQA